MPLPRRGFLVGVGALAGAATLAGCSSYDVAGASETGRFDSRYRNTTVGWRIVRPPGHDGERLPVLVALHSRGGDHEEPFEKLHLDRTLADTVASRTPPFALAAVDGGDHEYWHPRHGTDPAGMVVHEFLPLLARHGLDVTRLGLIGWSMGGYGALYLGTVLGRRRVSTLVAVSPAIWHRPGQQVEGSFDSDSDFARHAILPRVGRFAGIAMRIDCGDDDGFSYVVRDLRSAIRPTPAGGIGAGGHDRDYWRAQVPRELRWVGRRL